MLKPVKKACVYNSAPHKASPLRYYPRLWTVFDDRNKMLAICSVSYYNTHRVEIQNKIQNISLPRCELPLFTVRVEAGFPSPAEDYIDCDLDLNEHLIQHPAATYFVRVSGSSMIGAGIHDGDLLIVDRSVEPRDGDVVIAALLGELTLKRIHKRGGKVMLIPDNDAYPTIEVDQEAEFQVWGVCRHVIHSL